MRPSIRVVKVGGSLLDWPELPIALAEWIRSQPISVHLLIAGGGSLAQAIWQASRAFALPDDAAHWLCIDTMSATARLLAQVVSGVEFVSEFAALKERARNTVTGPVVCDCNSFLREYEHHSHGHVLPCDWSVSSDSIAARLAEVLEADELVLLKSADPPAGTIQDWENGSYVDEYFPAFAKSGFQIRFINLRGWWLNDKLAGSRCLQD